MIREAALLDALSRHIARTNLAGQVNALAPSVEIFDAGLDPDSAYEVAYRYALSTARALGYAADTDRVEAEAVAFVTGMVVGRTAREETES